MGLDHGCLIMWAHACMNEKRGKGSVCFGVWVCSSVGTRVCKCIDVHACGYVDVRMCEFTSVRLHGVYYVALEQQKN